MNALIQAEITITYPEYRNGWKLHSILTSCSTVSRLSLPMKSLMSLEGAGLKSLLPVFYNLNHLELGFARYGNWYRLIVEFLELSPCLNTLVFPEGVVSLREHEGYGLKHQSWEQTEPIPSCCTSHLKQIVIKEYYGLLLESRLVQFLLRKALVLENLVMSLSEDTRLLKIDQVSLQSVLEELPRASRNCSITVLS